MSLQYAYFDSPVGRLLLAADERGLVSIEFEQAARPVEPRADWRHDPAALRPAVAQLRKYFAGGLREFDLPLHMIGTPFQRSVWAALRKIPYGETTSYAEIARRIGRPAAVRAVGAANGRNPISIVVPCHRVIGSDGRLTGFGGGLGVKRALLELEGALPPSLLADQGL